MSEARKRFKRINVEITNSCNLKCPFCPEVHREARRMDDALFARIIEQAAPLSEEVCLHLMGEPLSHPRLAALSEICAAHGLPINLTTNGTLLDERRADTLLRPAFRQVNFSLHSFEANFPGQDPAAYLARIFAFTRRALAERPDLYVNYRLWDMTDPLALSPDSDRIRAALEREHGFTLAPSAVDLRRRKGHRIRGRLYVSLDSRFEWPSLEAPRRSEAGFCHALSNHFGVHADGTVVPCCLDKEAVLALGNARTEALAAILAGPRATAIARGFSDGRCVEELCRRCGFIQRFDSKRRGPPAQTTASHSM